MIAKLIILLFVVGILYSLGSALFYLVRGKHDSSRVVKALTWRISLSILLFILLFVAYGLGWIAPHDLSLGGSNGL
jgi:hypothetical protein